MLYWGRRQIMEFLYLEISREVESWRMIALSYGGAGVLSVRNRWWDHHRGVYRCRSFSDCGSYISCGRIVLRLRESLAWVSQGWGKCMHWWLNWYNNLILHRMGTNDNNSKIVYHIGYSPRQDTVGLVRYVPHDCRDSIRMREKYDDAYDI